RRCHSISGRCILPLRRAAQLRRSIHENVLIVSPDPAETLEADYVIAGGGSAGCVAARRLVDAGYSVILLEAGGDDRTPAVYVPAGSARLVGNSRFDWKYETEPDPSRNGRVDSWPSGKVLGGGGSING